MSELHVKAQANEIGRFVLLVLGPFLSEPTTPSRIRATLPLSDWGRVADRPCIIHAWRRTITRFSLI